MLTKSKSLPSNITSQIRDGSILAGNDFNAAQLERWFQEEKEAYFEIDSGNSEIDPWYSYMEYVNEKLGFKYILPNLNTINDVMFLGPGCGKEAEYLKLVKPDFNYHFIEASANFQSILNKRFPDSSIISPQCSGDIDIANNTIDLSCCFSVLHHIPNIFKIFTEISRITRPGGILLVREPCSSMGDWRNLRSATPNERGISKNLLTRFASDNGFDLLCKPIPILFEPINKFLRSTIGYKFVPFGILYAFDRFISKALSFHDYYWRDTFIKKIGPSSYFYIFTKN